MAEAAVIECQYIETGCAQLLAVAQLPANRPYDAAVGFTGNVDEVRVYNRVLSAAEVQTIESDTQPPTAPSSLTATAASSSEIDLSWGASTDNAGVTDYYVERCSGASCSNFVQVGTTSSTTYPDTGLTAATSYSYRVRATDAAGNLSGYSSIASATTSSGGGGGGGGGCSATSTLTYTYDSQGHLKTVTGAGGCTAQYTYDANGNLISVQVTQ
jgi:YD repeat-containing protein